MTKEEFKGIIAILAGYYPNIFKDLDSIIQDAINEDKKDLHKMIMSESVGILLRYGVKSPSLSGMDDCNDNLYYDLYDYRNELFKTMEGEK